MRFCLVSEATVPDESVNLLRDACRERGIPFEVIIAKTFDYDPTKRLEAGDLLYTAATSVAASRVEQFLFTPGVATFHAGVNGIFFSVRSQTQLAEFAGLPMPKTVYLASTNASLLKRQVERLGGFPVVVKVIGRSSGIGVMLAESMPSLRSQVDFVIAQGHNPLLCQFIRDAVHWRIIVLGGRAIASYRNKQIADDFRSCGSTDRADVAAPPPAEALQVSVRAAAMCGHEFAGVDVLEDPSGKVWFLEANFPCYYPHAQLHGGVNIAGQMVDFLAAKAGHAPIEPAKSGHKIQRLASTPDIFAIDDFIDAVDCDYVLAKADRIEAERPPEIVTKRDDTGFSFEMPVNGDSELARVMSRIHRVVGGESDLAFTFRFRRYTQGTSHPPHRDEYELVGRRLVATAILYLTDTERGGETHFPQALPASVQINPRRGRLAVWFNYRPDGAVEPAALHESLAVSSGVKATITHFIYKRIGDYQALRASSPLLRTTAIETSTNPGSAT
jgi:hypothetical protein